MRCRSAISRGKRSSVSSLRQIWPRSMPGMPCCSLRALSADTSLMVPSAVRRDARRPPFFSESARSSCSGLKARCRSRIFPSCFFSVIFSSIARNGSREPGAPSVVPPAEPGPGLLGLCVYGLEGDEACFRPPGIFAAQDGSARIGDEPSVEREIVLGDELAGEHLASKVEVPEIGPAVALAARRARAAVLERQG